MVGSPTELDVALEAIARGRVAGELESRALEFKLEGRDERDTGRILAEAAVCLSNAAGGVVVLGIDDKKKGPDAFVGSDLEIDAVRKLIHQRTKPPMTLDVDTVVAHGSRLLVIRVPEGLEVHQDSAGRAWRRVSAQDCFAMPPADQSRLREERAGYDWSAQASDRSIRDASPLALAAARRRLAALPDRRQELARLADGDLIRALGLADEADRLNRAGEVLFCDPVNGMEPAVLYQYRPTPAGEPALVERLPRPLVLSFERALELVDARRNTTPLTLPNGQQIAVADFPDLAVREAIGNAVIHRDYRQRSAAVVDHSRSTLVVDSPGPLVTGVTPQNILTHPSKPRNATLAKAFRTLGLAEETGRGVDRMYREMIRAGRDLPVIDDRLDGVRVILSGGAANTRIARFVAGLPDEERDDTDTMLVVFVLCSRPTTSAVDLAPILQKSRDEAEAVLRRLSSDPAGIVEPTRGTVRRANPLYRLRGEALSSLGPAVRYQRRTQDEIDRKVIAHIREYGKVTNRTLRNVFDVDMQRARAILTDLVARDILVKTSLQQRGPNIEYGPGTAFPHDRRSR